LYFPNKSPRVTKTPRLTSDSSIALNGREAKEEITAEAAGRGHVKPEGTAHQDFENEEEDIRSLPDSKKRKKVKAPSYAIPNKNYTICVKYDSILQLEFIKEDELVIVEQPWLTVLNSLPDPLERRIYGT
jgi:hypothetical protein